MIVVGSLLLLIIFTKNVICENCSLTDQRLTPGAPANSTDTQMTRTQDTLPPSSIIGHREGGTQQDYGSFSGGVNRRD